MVCTCYKISPRRDPGRRSSLSAVPKKHLTKNPHHYNYLYLDVSCMGPKSSPIPSDEYHSHDLVHGIREKPSSTDCDGPCRAGTPKFFCHLASSHPSSLLSRVLRLYTKTVIKAHSIQCVLHFHPWWQNQKYTCVPRGRHTRREGPAGRVMV